MREIKFRGKTVTGEWVYGNLAIVKTNQMRNVKCGSYISNDCGLPFAYQVIPETVGQYIGNKDKNQTEVYHGDLLQMYRHDDITGKHEKGKIWHEGKYENDIRQVAFMNGTFYTMGEYGIEIAFMHLARPGESYKVIGNIHD